MAKRQDSLYEGGLRWTCSNCTFVNIPRCGMCEAERPDEEEERRYKTTLTCFQCQKLLVKGHRALDGAREDQIIIVSISPPAVDLHPLVLPHNRDCEWKWKCMNCTFVNVPKCGMCKSEKPEDKELHKDEAALDFAGEMERHKVWEKETKNRHIFLSISPECVNFELDNIAAKEWKLRFACPNCKCDNCKTTNVEEEIVEDDPNTKEEVKRKPNPEEEVKRKPIRVFNLESEDEVKIKASSEDEVKSKPMFGDEAHRKREMVASSSSTELYVNVEGPPLKKMKQVQAHLEHTPHPENPIGIDVSDTDVKDDPSRMSESEPKVVTPEELQRIEQAKASYDEYLKEDHKEYISNKDEFECQICYDTIAPGDGIVLRGCLHMFCKLTVDGIKYNSVQNKFIGILVMECLNRTIMMSPDAQVKCPYVGEDYKCIIFERDVKAVLSPEELGKYYHRSLYQAEGKDSFHCCTTDCPYFIYCGSEVSEFLCPRCKKKNCLICHAIHEGMNCQEYQDDLDRIADNDKAAKATENEIHNTISRGKAMYCPECRMVVQKTEGCDWIQCAKCRTEICWATKMRRWGPKGHGDLSGGCGCRPGKKCHPKCQNCH